jgi:hypothetical protein
MHAWQTAVEFLLVGDRARVLARGHPLTVDGRCGRCGSDCTAAVLAAEALAVLTQGHTAGGPR